MEGLVSRWLRTLCLWLLLGGLSCGLPLAQASWEAHQRAGEEAASQGRLAEARGQFLAAVREARHMGLQGAELDISLRSLARLNSGGSRHRRPRGRVQQRSGRRPRARPGLVAPRQPTRPQPRLTPPRPARRSPAVRQPRATVRQTVPPRPARRSPTVRRPLRASRVTSPARTREGRAMLRSHRGRQLPRSPEAVRRVESQRFRRTGPASKAPRQARRETRKRYSRRLLQQPAPVLRRAGAERR